MNTILFVASHGAKQPSRATMPFAAALMAAQAGAQPQVLLSGEATLLVKGSVARTVHAVDWPALPALFRRLVTHGIPVFACETCGRDRGVTEDDLAWTNATFVCQLAILELKTRADKVLAL